MNKKTENLKVAIRVRPALSREVNEGFFKNCLAVDKQKIFISLKDKPIIINNQSKQIEGVDIYQFDQVFEDNRQQVDIYEGIVQESVNHVLGGFNATIFCYGQTGSGKTYTVFGEQGEKMGFAPRAIQEIYQNIDRIKQHQEDEDFDENIDIDDEIDDDISSLPETDLQHIEISKSQVFVSLIQIYNDQVQDLLVKQPKQLKVRLDQRKNYFIQDLTQQSPSSAQKMYKLIQKGLSRRFISKTNMNEQSSRSHIILTIHVNQIDQFDNLISGKLNIVDLAGSEKVKQSGAQGKVLKEACFINQSLYYLQNVVNGLSQQKKVSYRDSQLTKILKDSLGGNCRTTLIGTISPSIEFKNESNNTLKFSQSCKSILNFIKCNKYKSSIPKSIPFKPKIKKDIQTLPWNTDEFMNIKNKYIIQKIDVQPFGKINTLQLMCNDNNKWAIFLHGCPSCVYEFEHWFKSFMYMNLNILAIDMPGYGDSEGQCIKSRSEYILENQGPAYVVKQVLSYFKIKKPILVGYDWGASIALRMAAQDSSQFLKIISFHPAYTEIDNELQKLKTQTLIIWIKQDQFHNFKKFSPLVKKIKNCELYVKDTKVWKPEMAQYSY